MIALILAGTSLFLALNVALLVVWNLTCFRRLPAPRDGVVLGVSVLIPARNEEQVISAAVQAALASREVEIEVIVLDDHSQDATAQLVSQIAQQDPRVRVEPAPPLPEGWCGKQHACWVLAQHARHDLLVWIDADVRLEPAALTHMAHYMAARPKLGLLSGFPRQVTVSWLERLLIPLIHFVLLGYLPMIGMRLTSLPVFAAGCGQLFMARRPAYLKSGGHAAIRASLHDGITLPRTFRQKGIWTDIFDASDLAECRMYHAAPEVWHGLAKNATEGMASPAGILPWTLLLLGGHVLPWVLSAWLSLHPLGRAFWLALSAVGVGLLVRLALAVRFQQPWGAALLHPVAITLLVAIQWYALARRVLGLGSSWKGRQYGASRR